MPLLIALGVAVAVAVGLALAARDNREPRRQVETFSPRALAHLRALEHEDEEPPDFPAA